MLEFRHLELEDRAWLQPLLAKTNNMGSENAFGTLIIWRGDYRVYVAKRQDEVFLSFGNEPHTYCFPIAYHNLKDALSLMIADADKKGFGLRMWGMTQEQTTLIEQAMPGAFAFTLDRPGSDYMYSAEDLVSLKGRKFEKKRNHLAKFKRTYSYTYEDITISNIAECVAISEHWRDANAAQLGESVHKEYCAVRRAVDNYEQLGLLGGLIRIEGKPVAFTIGEEINPAVFLVHFEKALDEYDGLYAAINQEFAAHHLATYQYVNREEDMGVEGLRKSKLSYHPVLLLEKYRAVLKEVANK
ncbi:MAG: phosphatidylglycerol lysyltransferase domain-containing protein [Bacillota bacterium]|nr:phosphatidylglycerol lysyltransferase domain-containing protein [Bacillota bacterium]